MVSSLKYLHLFLRGDLLVGLVGIKNGKHNTKVDKLKTALDCSLFYCHYYLLYYFINTFKISIILIDNTFNLQHFTPGRVATCPQIKLIYN